MEKKKSLGQNFLKAASYVRAIADAAQVAAGDTVLEIGPGDGALTRELLLRGAHVIAIEKDRRLIPVLTETFSKEIANKIFSVHEADALAILPEELGLAEGGYKLVANIPYYITGALLKKFLSEVAQPSLLVFLVQKEVAERIAREKKESILSLSVKAYGTPKYIKTVPRGAFAPAPDVDSAILLVSPISRNNFKNKEREEHFFALVRAGFAQKRKLLRRNIESVLGESALVRMQNAGIPENARAEDVPLQKWLVLAQ